MLIDFGKIKNESEFRWQRMTEDVVSEGWKIAGSLKNSYVYLAQDS
jgi:hypothetical protein